MPHESYDVIVVGGGPAGTAFARMALTLAAPWRVLVIEKARFPRDKTCGDALTYRSIPLVRELFPELQWLTPSTSVTTMQVLHYPGGHVLRRKTSQLDVIPRKVLDAALWSSIAGTRIETMEATTVEDVVVADGHVVGVRAATSDGVREMRCRWLLGADGSRSLVRARTGPVDRDSVIFAVRQYVRGIAPGADALLFFLDIEKNGYFWIFPFAKDGERWANVGYGNSFVPVSLTDRFREYCARPEVRRFLGSGELVGKLVGFPLNLAPVRWGRVRLARPLSGPGYLLLGDAASLIHPLSGEGIAFALQSGKLAAEVLADPGIGEARKGREYERRVLRYVTPFFTSMATLLAIRLPVLLPRRLSNLYLRSAAWLQAMTGWGTT